MDEIQPQEPDRERRSSDLTRRRFLQYSGFVSLGALLAAACGGDDDEEAAAPEGGEAAGTGAAAETDTGAAEPVRGGTLKVATFKGGVDTIDPHRLGDDHSVLRASQMFETLLNLDEVEGLISGSPGPRLAESVEPNDAWTEFTVTLREGVLFHDGSPMTADDVVWSFQRAYNPDHGFPFAGANLVGIDFANIRKVDDLTVVLPFASANTAVLNDLTSYPYIVKNGQDEFTADNLIGTGPFKLVSYTPDQRTELERNPDYWSEGEPYIDGVELINYADDTGRLNSLLAGQTNIVHALDTPLVKQYEDDENFKLQRDPGSSAWSFYMRLDTDPFTDERVRQAFRLAVDRQQLVDSVLLGFGAIGNDVPGKGYVDYNADLEQRPYDPDQAKALLAEAGFGDGIEVTGLTYPDRAAEFTAFAEQAKAAGITINVRTLPLEQYYTEDYWPEPPTGFAQTRWGGDFTGSVPQQYLTSAPYNETGWKNAEWDERFQTAIGTLDADERNAMMKELQVDLYNEGGQIIWGFSDRLVLMSQSVDGIKHWIDRSLGGFDFRQVTVSE